MRPCKMRRVTVSLVLVLCCLPSPGISIFTQAQHRSLQLLLSYSLNLNPKKPRTQWSQEAAAREAAEARELVEEVRAVVAENYLDARGSGWDPAAWDAACRRVLAGPLRDTAAAHRCECLY